MCDENDLMSGVNLQPQANFHQTNGVTELSDNTISLSSDDIDQVHRLLGREPRGLEAIPVRSKTGGPVVIQVAPLVDDKPFPTLFWLVDPRLNYAIDQVEAAGVIALLQAKIDASTALQQAMVKDHQSYIEYRWRAMTHVHKQQVERLGFVDVLQRRGIGGIENFKRIRCLHTYYAAHLVAPNTVGGLLEDYWSSHGMPVFDHIG